MNANGRSRCLAIGLAAATLAACAGSQAGSTMSASSSGGDVARMGGSGMWIDSAGGTWMDTAGAVWSRGAGGSVLALKPEDVAGMNNANIVAHLSMGDSVAIALSQAGVTRGEHAEVRSFAERMVKEHTRHMQMAMQMTTQGGLTPAHAPADTADLAMAINVIGQLESTHHGADYDKKFMRAEVMLHQHTLHDLTILRPQASGAALQAIDQTIPIVRKHLSDAQTVLYIALDDRAGSRREGALRPPPR